MFRKKMAAELGLLLPWLLFVTGFTVISDIEARALIPAMPAYVLFATFGLSEVTKVLVKCNPSTRSVRYCRFCGTSLSVDAKFCRLCRKRQEAVPVTTGVGRHLSLLMKASLLSVAIIVGNFQFTELAIGAKGTFTLGQLLWQVTHGTTGWFSDYLQYLNGKLTSSALLIDPVYVIEAIMCIAITVGFLCSVLSSVVPTHKFDPYG
jgi:hypothetical protein